jgi:2-dehydro-3-deoxyphosphogluconate aldolase/(4S)-4-hydroxy-2-oxoglutarate aldolase
MTLDVHGAYATIERERLFAILRPTAGEDAVGLLGALAGGGIRCAEISFATATGRTALPRCAAELGDRVLLGAGTVRTVADAEAAVAAGARFLVSPGFAPDVHTWARAAGIAHLPGVLTPTELDAALQAGAPLVKLFPAGRLGAAYVRDLVNPFPDARLVAVGAIDAATAPTFIAAGAAAVALGSSLIPAGAGADLAALSERAAQALRALSLPTLREAS